MSKANFLDKSNVSTLWDVIADEELFKNNSPDAKNNILQIFSENIKNFYNSESRNNKITLMEMNKKYILMILQFIKTNFPLPSVKKIVIHNEPISLNNDFITVEERQKERISQFDKDFNKIQEDFKNAISRPIPEAPDFRDNIKEEPIIEMERAIKEMAEQRNYDMEQINKSYNESDNINGNSKSSIKSNLSSSMKNSQTFSEFEKNPMDLNKRQVITPKHIRWLDQAKEKWQGKESSQSENIDISFEEEPDLFSKLKTISSNNSEPYMNKVNILEERINDLHSQLNVEIQNIHLRMNQLFELLQNK
jgi:hypothetical protein